MSAAEPHPAPLVARAVARSLSGRVAAATHEVEQLVEATYRIVSRDGTVDPRVRDILLEADLSTQAFYRHFRSKDDLLLVLLDDERQEFRVSSGARTSRPEKPRERVRARTGGIGHDQYSFLSCRPTGSDLSSSEWVIRSNIRSILG